MMKFESGVTVYRHAAERDGAAVDCAKSSRDVRRVHCARLGRRHLAVHAVRVARLAILLGSHLDLARAWQRRKSVEEVFGLRSVHPHVGGAPPGRVCARLGYWEPVQYLAVGHEQPVERWAEQPSCPSAGRDDYLIGFDRDLACLDQYGRALLAYFVYRASGQDRGARLGGTAQLRGDAPFRIDEAAAWLEISLVLAAPESGESRRDGGAVQLLMRDAVASGDRDRSGQEVRLAVVPGPAAAPRHDEQAALLHQRFARLLFQRAPDGMRSAHQRHVSLALTDRAAGDTRIAVA